MSPRRGAGHPEPAEPEKEKNSPAARTEVGDRAAKVLSICRFVANKDDDARLVSLTSQLALTRYLRQRARGNAGGWTRTEFSFSISGIVEQEQNHLRTPAHRAPLFWL